MTTFFFDASALVKRYVTEPGSQWTQGTTDVSGGHTIIVAEITQVEVAAAFAARHRAPQGISKQQRDRIINLLLFHCHAQYRAVSLNQTSLNRAVNLTKNHRLRGYDAVQLAVALVTNDTLINAGLSELTFVTADSDLINAAQGEGLNTDNPNLYP